MTTSTTTLRELRPGAQLANRYALIKRLGSGGQAEVWLAEDRISRSEVALKILVSPNANRQVLHNEWQTAIRLVHPHIARVFEFHDDAAGAFYSQQYVGSADASVLTGKAAGAVLPVVAAIADALRYAHGRSVVHRDVKASNVLLDGVGAPYLIDFGVASEEGANASGGSLVAASPAQRAGEPATGADDVFALGVLTYELLTGGPPFDPAATGDVATDGFPPSVSALAGDELPAEVIALVTAMLAAEAEDRPTAADVVATLENAGFRRGAAPRELVGDGANLAAETVAANVPDARSDAPLPRSSAAGSVESGGGLRPATVWGGLAVLAGLLLVVVFYLPRQVADAPATDAAEPALPVEAGADEETPAGAATESAATESPTPPARDERVAARQSTEAVLGRLLSMMQTLEGRGVERWGGLRYAQAKAAYELGDEAFLARDYTVATSEYDKAIELLEPLLDEVNEVFAETLATAEAALAAGDARVAVENYDLAVAISPSDRVALEGLERARNLDEVMDLVADGERFAANLEFDLAVNAFERAIEIDDQWQPARDGLSRVREAAAQMDFDSRMSEGLAALADNDYRAARAAFERAEALRPGTSEVRDGLLQVDQGTRLGRIRALEADVVELKQAERWEDAVDRYEQILELDPNLAFAQQGMAQSREMVNIHRQLADYIDNPDSLSVPATMQRATNLVLTVTRLPEVGDRLAGERDELSRLLKRAATPLTVEIVSDNLTNVSIHKVGRLGTFASQRLELRPGTYVAVGSRPGYRDVRLEFRVAPEVAMQPVVVRCEEPI